MHWKAVRGGCTRMVAAKVCPKGMRVSVVSFTQSSAHVFIQEPQRAIRGRTGATIPKIRAVRSPRREVESCSWMAAVR